MKSCIFAVLLILAGAFAVPAQISDNRDIATDFIRDLIHNLAQRIKDSGLDLYEIKTFAYEYSGNALQFKLGVQDLLFTGASNIVISRLFNNVFSSTFHFDVVLPELKLTLGSASVDAVLNRNNINAEIGGSLAIKNIRLAGVATYYGNIIVGVRIVDIKLDSSIGSLEPDVTATANGENYSARINTFFSDTLPNTLHNFRIEINDFIARAILDLINRPWK